MDCLFCRIVAKKLKANILYEDDKLLAFHDISPKAPVHALIIPKKHIETVDHLQQEDALLVGELLLVAKKLARELDLSEEGYRLVMNCNKQGGQLVFHLHLHLLGGRQMSWPPG